MRKSESDGIEALISGWTTPEPTTYQGSDSVAFQRWFKFKEAFAPTLVQSILDGLSKRPRRVLDCCAGSGTTGVVAQFSGINSTLVEVNPFLADLIESKLANYEGVELHLELARILDRAASQNVTLEALRARLPPTFVEPGVGERWLFDRTVAKEIERLRLGIEASRKPLVRRLFRVALASTLVGLSNVRVDGKGRRYRQNWQERSVQSSDVRDRFIEASTRMAQDIYRHSGRDFGAHRVINGDSRLVLPTIPGPVDLVLFSPPYPNSFDYTDIYNIELWVLGYLRRPADNTDLRRRTVRSHVQVTWEAPNGTVRSPSLERTVKALQEKREELWDRRLPEMVQAYFEDMQSLLCGMQRCLSVDGTIAIVVGDSSYAQVHIDSAKILTNIAEQLGWSLVSRRSARVMRASMQHNRGAKALDEWLLLFRRSSN